MKTAQSKIPVYFIPGLAAGPRIFEYLELPEDRYEVKYLEWLLPESVDEKLSHYAKRMAKEIKHPEPVLIGVSFGGILAQEIARILPVRKLILISSVKSRKEFPKRLIVLQKLRIYKLFPARYFENIDRFNRYAFGNTLKKKIKLYQKYLYVRNRHYINWAIRQVLNWKQKEFPKDIIHLHGDKDQIFPIRYIRNCIVIEGGNHAMVIIKAKKISKIIRNSLT